MYKEIPVLLFLQVPKPPLCQCPNVRVKIYNEDVKKKQVATPAILISCVPKVFHKEQIQTNVTNELRNPSQKYSMFKAIMGWLMSDTCRKTTIGSVLVSSEQHKAGETFFDDGHCEILLFNRQCKPDRKAVTLNLLKKVFKSQKCQFSEYLFNGPQ